MMRTPSAPLTGEPGSEASTDTIRLAVLSCGISATFGWTNVRRRQVAAAASTATGFTADISPLVARAADGSSVEVVIDFLNNPSLGFVFLTALDKLFKDPAVQNAMKNAGEHALGDPAAQEAFAMSASASSTLGAYVRKRPAAAPPCS